MEVKHFLLAFWLTNCTSQARHGLKTAFIQLPISLTIAQPSTPPHHPNSCCVIPQPLAQKRLKLLRTSSLLPGLLGGLSITVGSAGSAASMIPRVHAVT